MLAVGTKKRLWPGMLACLLLMPLTVFTGELRAKNAEITEPAGVQGLQQNDAGGKPDIRHIPAAPNGVVAIPGDDQVAVSWQSVPQASSYNVYWAANSFTDRQKARKITGVSSPFFHNDLKLGLSYHYVVTAQNDDGESAVSTQVSATTIAPFPSSPVGLVAVEGDRQNTIKWNPVKGASSYILRWANEPGITGSNSFAFEEIQPPFVHKNLENGLSYYYTVIAVNDRGQSNFSYEVSAIPGTAPSESQPAGPGINPSLPAPKAVVTVPNNKQVFISWDTVENAEQYHVFWSTEPGVTRQGSEKIMNLKPGDAHTGLTNGSTYYYRVAASNAQGDGALSREVSATPQIVAPASIEDIAITTGEKSIKLQWNRTPGIEQYNVYWNTKGKVTTGDAKFAKVSPPFMHEGLVPGKTYYYVIEAINKAGKFVSHGIAASLLPLAPVISSISVKDLKTTLSWEATAADSFNVYWDTTARVNTSSNRIENVKSPYEHGGLKSGEKYFYIVTAVNNSGESASGAGSVTTPPDAPLIKSLSAGDKKVKIAIQGPHGATAYNIYWSTSAAPGKQDKSIKAVTADFVHEGLVNGNTYYYKVTATNEGGESPLSAGNKIVLSPDAPNITKIKIKGTSAILEWTRVPGAQSYNVYWNTTGKVSESDLNLVKPGNIPVTPPFEHTGLEKGKTYYYVVTASNKGGESVFKKPVSAVLTPSVPQITATVAGNRQVQLKWTEVDGSASYNIYWHDDIDKTVRKIALPVEKISMSEPSFKHEGIDNGKQYFYTVSAVNAGGESKQSKQENVILTPDTPVFTSAKEGDETAIVAWTNVGYADSYTIYWGTQPGVDQSSEKILQATSPYKFTGLTNKQDYYFRVVAINRAGESPMSAEAKIMPQKRSLDILFTDRNFQKCVNRLIKSKGWQTADDITGTLKCDNKRIESISGVEDLVNLQGLSLKKNKISELKYLSGLTRLTSLSLGSNQIKDISPLANLTGLTSLQLHRNKISDISPLSGLVKLNYLSLYKNKVIEVQSLQNLTLLTSLYLSSNKISDASPLSGLTNINFLDLGKNRLGGKGLGNIVSLQSLKHANRIVLGGNTGVSCAELSTLIKTMGSPPVDTDGIDTNFDVASQGVNCSSP